MSRSPETPGRLAGLDNLKGVSILLVVVIHAAPGAPAWYQDQLVNGVARLAVPTFLVVTGFLNGLKGSSRAKLAGYFWTFLRLHVVYGAFYFVVTSLRDGLPEELTWKALLRPFGEASFAGQFYLVVLVQCFFVVAFLLPARAWRHGFVVLLSLLAAAGGFFVVHHVSVSPDPASLPGWSRRVLGSPNVVWLWIYYFLLGAFLGQRAFGGGFRGPALVPLLAVGIVLAAADFPPLPGWEHPPREPYARLSILAGSTLVALCVPALARAPAVPLLRPLGIDSFGVFVFNPAILMLLVGAFGQPTVRTSWLYVLATVVVAVPLSRFVRRRIPLMAP